MENKKIRWLIYTVLVGLIPITSRLIAWTVASRGTVDPIAPSDFVAFGLVLHISNINEIEHIAEIHSNWKTAQTGISVTFIAFYSVLLAFTLIGGTVVDAKALAICTIVMSAISLLISYSVYHRASKISAFNVEATK